MGQFILSDRSQQPADTSRSLEALAVKYATKVPRPDDLSHYLRSGGGRENDNHSETQGYLLILRVQRLVWRLIAKAFGAGLALGVGWDVVAPDPEEFGFEQLEALTQEVFEGLLGQLGWQHVGFAEQEIVPSICVASS